MTLSRRSFIEILGLAGAAVGLPVLPRERMPAPPEPVLFDGPLEVYVNGLRYQEGPDFSVRSDQLYLEHPSEPGDVIMLRYTDRVESYEIFEAR